MKKLLYILMIFLCLGAITPIKAQNPTVKPLIKTDEKNSKNKPVWWQDTKLITTIIAALFSTIGIFITAILGRKNQKKLVEFQALQSKSIEDLKAEHTRGIEELKAEHLKDIENSKRKLEQANLLSSLIHNLASENTNERLLAIQAIKHRVSPEFAIDIIDSSVKQGNISTQDIDGINNEVITILYKEMIDVVFEGDERSSKITTREFFKLSHKIKENQLFILIEELFKKADHEGYAINNALDILRHYAKRMANIMHHNKSQMIYERILKNMHQTFEAKQNPDATKKVSKIYMAIYRKPIKE